MTSAVSSASNSTNPLTNLVTGNIPGVMGNATAIESKASGLDAAKQAAITGVNTATGQATNAVNTAIGQGIGAVNAATGQATGTIQAGADKAAAQYSPYTSLGSGATDQLKSLLGIGGDSGTTLKALESTPGYKFTQGQGDQATINAASASGMNLSGNTLEALSKYNAGLADQTYQNAVSNTQGAVNTGLSAASGTAGAIQTGANAVGAVQAGSGNTLASLYGGQGSDLANISLGQGTNLANIELAGFQGKSNMLGDLTGAVGGIVGGLI